MRNNQRVKIPTGKDHFLSGILELPSSGEPRAFGVFAHCFTCTKDLKAIVRISRRLAEQGFGVLRFDFTGLGESGGNFSHTTFRDNVAEVEAAAKFLADQYAAPTFLIGHSLGGAASIVAAPNIRSVKCVVNIASPSNTHHLARFLAKQNPDITSKGEGSVVIGGRSHLIRKAMLDALLAHDHPSAIRNLKMPFLVMFSPSDETLPFDHGLELFNLATGPKSFITIDGADHLLVNQPDDVNFVGDVVGLWLSRYAA